MYALEHKRPILTRITTVLGKNLLHLLKLKVAVMRFKTDRYVTKMFL